MAHQRYSSGSGNQTLNLIMGAQWLSGRVLDSRPRGRGFEPHQRHCVVSLNKNINPSLILVQSRKTRPFITKRLLMGLKKSNQTNKNLIMQIKFVCFYVYIIYSNALQTTLDNGSKHYEPGSDCSLWSSQIRVHIVCSIYSKD